MRTLLQLTDNIVGDDVVPPADTVRHDGDDPYLVVAADKGTATFSDTANALSKEKGHWLGDAFASGGSQGYDHKKMGITARGAWEAVKRHFREMDIDIQTRARHGGGRRRHVGRRVRQRHAAVAQAQAASRPSIIATSSSIPTPIRKRSFVERERLFDLPRSSWQDYDKALISKGGGMFPRSAKSIPLSEEVRALLGIDKAEATPAEVMSAILKAPVGLLWFGGIGTYIRAVHRDRRAGRRPRQRCRSASPARMCAPR